jgi:hypothetical protein
MFSAKKYYKDHGILYSESHNSKNMGPNWIGISCPFCNDPSDHGGFNLLKGYYNCWRCGWHSITDLIIALQDVSFIEAIMIEKEYDTIVETTSIRQKIIRTSATQIKLPLGTKPLQAIHKKYLLQRNFNPKELEKTWRILGTGTTGDYKYRIIAPITLNNKLVSYQGRDITNKAKLRYKACSLDKEIIHRRS